MHVRRPVLFSLPSLATRILSISVTGPFRDSGVYVTVERLPVLPGRRAQ